MSRLPLAILCVLLCVHGLFAGPVLTFKDISLMLRSGYSSKAILAELETRHFAIALDAQEEQDLKALRASPELIAALKDHKNTASVQEVVAQVHQSNQRADEAERITREAMQQLAEKQQQASARVVVAPSAPQSSGITFMLPSEIEAAKRAAKIAEIVARQKYCAEHPIECETLDAIKAARSDAEDARREVRSLKTDLWMRGIRP